MVQVTNSIGALFATIWAMSKALTYKPLAVFVSLLGLLYADYVVYFLIAAYKTSRNTRKLFSDFPAEVVRVYLQVSQFLMWYVDEARKKSDEAGAIVYLMTLCVTAICLVVTIIFLISILRTMVESIKTLNHNRRVVYEVERMIHGSLLEDKAITPSFQVAIYTDSMVDSKLRYRGTGFRIGNKLNTALHVIEDCRDIKVVGPQGEIYLSPDDFIDTHTEVTWIELTGLHWSVLGAKSAVLAKVMPKEVFARVTANGKASYGIVQDNHTMGMVSFTGSTTAGFSGSPYAVGRTVYGLHIGADKVANIGFSASYIAMLHRMADKPAPILEDSADFLIGQLARYDQEEFIYEQNPMDAYEFRVKAGGMYHVVDAETFHKLSEVRRARRSDQRGDLQFEDARNDLHFLAERHPQEAEEFPLPPADLKQRAEQVEVAPAAPVIEILESQNNQPEMDQTQERFQKLENTLEKLQQLIMVSLAKQDVSPPPQEPSIQTTVTTVDASMYPQAGLVSGPPNAQRYAGPMYVYQPYEFPTPIQNLGTYTQESMRVQPRNHSTSTTTSGSRQQSQGLTKAQKTARRIVRLEEELAQLRRGTSRPQSPRRSGNSNPGVSTSAVRPIQASTSRDSS